MKKKKKLTPKQHKLRQAIGYVTYVGKMDPDDLPDDPELHTTHLEHVLNNLVRAEVHSQYTLVDEYLTLIICHYFFKKPKVRLRYNELWRTKKFRLFNHYITDEMPLPGKVRLVHAIQPLPKPVRNSLERINAVRNSLAHSMFPENRRRHRGDRRVLYRGADVFGMLGQQYFAEDVSEVLDVLQPLIFGKRLPPLGASLGTATGNLEKLQ